MPRRQCAGKFWIFKAGTECQKGQDTYEAGDYDGLVFFDTEAERDADPDVVAFLADIARTEEASVLSAMDKTQEHAGKSENADRWWHNNGELPLLDPLYDVGDYTETSYPWLHVEMTVFDMTPRECVASIRNAKSSALAQAQARAVMRKGLSE